MPRELQPLSGFVVRHRETVRIGFWACGGLRREGK
jgi:hypothetical protein